MMDAELDSCTLKTECKNTMLDKIMAMGYFWGASAIAVHYWDKQLRQ